MSDIDLFAGCGRFWEVVLGRDGFCVEACVKATVLTDVLRA